MLYSAGGGADARWGVVATDRPARVGDGPINVAQLETWVDPRAEWAEIFRETWRNQRDYLLRPQDARRRLAGRVAKYSAAPRRTSIIARTRLPHRADRRRAVVGHSYLTGAGDVPADTPVSSACSAPITRSRTGTIASIAFYTGENWNPELRAPLQRTGHPSRGGRLSARGERPAGCAADERLSGLRGHGRASDRASRQQHAVARRVATGDGRAGRERGRLAHARMDRGQSPQGRRAVGRPARVRLAAQHVDARLQRIHALLLCAAGQGRRGHRRAVQSWRTRRRLHRERARSQSRWATSRMRDGKTWTSPARRHLSVRR